MNGGCVSEGVSKRLPKITHLGGGDWRYAVGGAGGATPVGPRLMGGCGGGDGGFGAYVLPGGGGCAHEAALGLRTYCTVTVPFPHSCPEPDGFVMGL
jgi:hypothetical protein